MELLTILNRCHHFRDFDYQQVRFTADKKSIQIAVRPALVRVRRVDCRSGAMAVEQVPWADGKHTLTKTHMLSLARWARRLCWRILLTKWILHVNLLHF